MIDYQGSIEDCLASGEYDQGDRCLVDYDELYDLVEQAKIMAQGFGGDSISRAQDIAAIERTTNRPLHPCLGGKSPYSEYLPI